MTPRCLQAPTGRAASLAATIATNVPLLLTERLRLRAPRIEDHADWYRAWEGLEDDWDDESAFGSFCVYVAGWMLHGHGVWTVERRDNGATVGFLQLGLEWGDEEPEIGWGLLPEARDNGFATEAAQAIRDFALAGHLETPPVSYIDPDNTASVRVAERVGARCDGTIGEDGTLIFRHRPAEAHK